MRRDRVCSQSLAQVMGNSLRQPSCVHKDECGAMVSNQLGQPVVNLLLHLVRGDRSQLASRHFDRKVKCPPVADVNDGRFRPVVPGQELRYKLDGLLRRRESDTHRRPVGMGLCYQSLQPLK